MDSQHQRNMCRMGGSYRRVIRSWYGRAETHSNFCLGVCIRGYFSPYDAGPGIGRLESEAYTRTRSVALQLHLRLLSFGVHSNRIMEHGETGKITTKSKHSRKIFHLATYIFIVQSKSPQEEVQCSKITFLGCQFGHFIVNSVGSSNLVDIYESKVGIG